MTTIRDWSRTGQKRPELDATHARWLIVHKLERCGLRPSCGLKRGEQDRKPVTTNQAPGEDQILYGMGAPEVWHPPWIDRRRWRRCPILLPRKRTTDVALWHLTDDRR